MSPSALTVSQVRQTSSFVHTGREPNSPLVPARIPGYPMARACCVLGEWIVILDGGRLRQARSRAGLTQRELARKSEVGLTTIGRLERQSRPHCHFRTRARLAMALGAHPKALAADTSSHPEGGASASRPQGAGQDDLHSRRMLTRTFPARADQVRLARAFVRQVLGDTPVTDTAVLVCSELATNAVLHSVSAQPGGSFAVHVEARPGDHAWVEVHDQGGRWIHQPRASGGRGLSLVDELATHWDIRGDDTARIICAQLNWPNSRRPG